tara:strand:+ start:373 stop:789 length:417 start_codon:yes stop_codon:yes gene_type:complete
MKLKEISMLTAYFLIGLGGIIIGGVSTLVITKDKKEPVSQPVSPIIVEPVDPVSDVAKQLTNLDLLVEPCSAEYIKENGDLLCREMYCRVMQRGVEAKTSGVECEEISNVANSQIIINHCESFLDGSKECYEKYRERK